MKNLTITCLITALNEPNPATCCLAVTILTVSLLGLYRKRLFAVCFLHPYSVWHKKQYYRLFTSDFVHNDFVHLVLNLITLLVFGSALEENLLKRSGNGSWQFLLIFFTSEIFANLLYSATNRNRFDESSAGCSASVTGCLFACMVADPGGTALNYYYLGGVKNLYTGPIYILLLCYYAWKNKNDMVNHEIHFYGAVIGIIGVLLYVPHIILKIPGI